MGRLERCLRRLLPHLDGDGVALTGGVALEHHLPGSRGEIADVDFVARRMEVVAPSVARDLLVSHYHVVQPGVPKAMVQLVDPETRLRIDLFPDLGGVIARAQRGVVGGALILVVRAADLLAHKLQLLGKPVDEKHWRDACALATLCGAPAPPRPEAITPDVYSQDLALVCDRCARSRSPDFPLAPKRAIFELLGYV
ncbi:MAG: hypothetical protein ACXVAN_02165 [Polyangia bacterium]